MTPLNPLELAAQNYASRGWRVIPLAGKRPHRLAGAWKDTATTNEGTIRQWWATAPDANVGIVCGNGLIVVDVDDPEDVAHLPGELPPTRTSLTGRGDGALGAEGPRHLFYAWPARTPAPNSAGKLAPGIDTRGDGGYVVAPPSVHPASGRAYVWHDPSVLVAPAPGWLVAALTEKPQERATPAPRMTCRDDDDRVLDRARAYVARMPPAIQGAAGHTDLLAAARALVVGFDLDDGTALRVLLEDFNPRCVPPWSAAEVEEIERKLSEARKTSTSTPGYLRDRPPPGVGRAAPLGREGDPQTLSRTSKSTTFTDEPTMEHDEGNPWADVPHPADTCDEDSEGWPSAPVDPYGDEDVPEAVDPPEAVPMPERDDEAADDIGDDLELEILHGLGSGPLARGSEEEVAGRLHRSAERVCGVAPVYDLGDVWAYSRKAGIWEAVDENAIMRLAGDFDGRDVDEAPKPMKVSSNFAKGVARLWRARPRGTAGFFDAAPTGLGFADGFLAVRGDRLELIPHAPGNRCRHRYNFARPGALTAPCDLWTRAMGEWGLTDRQQSWLAEWVGVALVGLATKAGKALMLLGEGRNGKSTFMDVVVNLFPDEWRAAVKPQDLADKFRLATLAGARLNALADIPERALLDVGTLKGVITGDVQQAERKYRDPFTFRPRAAHLWSCNELPRIADDTDGAWRRLAAIRFTKRIAEGATDIDLAKRIGDTERAGIVAWALRGAEAWLARRHFPDLEGDLAAEWRESSNPVALWKRDCTEDGGWTVTDACYASYKAWCGSNGHQPVSSTKFGTLLGKLVEWRTSGKKLYALTLASAAVPSGYTTASWSN